MTQANTKDTSYLDQGPSQQGPEDAPLPDWEAWGGAPDTSPENLVTEGVAEGAYKQPARKYITPAAHFVERFGTMHAAATPYHPYTLAVGMNAVREYFQGKGYTDAEAGMMAVAAFDIHVKSGVLLNPDRGRTAVEMSKQGVDINVEERKFKQQQAQRYKELDRDNALQSEPPDVDFDALEQAVAPAVDTLPDVPVPRVDAEVINNAAEA